MSTVPSNVINALLADANFNAIVASLKAKRDEISGYQYTIDTYNAAINNATAALTAARAAEAAIQTQLQTAGAAIVAAHLA